MLLADVQHDEVSGVISLLVIFVELNFLLIDANFHRELSRVVHKVFRNTVIRQSDRTKIIQAGFTVSVQ